MPYVMEVELLTTEGCHLCDQAQAMLERVRPDILVCKCDIAESDELIERYGERIPVFRHAGRELAWPFGLLDLQAFVGEST